MTHRPLISWLLALNVLGFMPWTYGPVAFICLIAAVVLLWQLAHADKCATAPASTLNRSFVIVVLLSAILTCAGLFFNPDWIIDIAQNTHAATNHIAAGNNPYSHTAQLWVKTFPADTPNLAVENGQITMFGVPYYHGFPYFPMMALSYLPIHLLLDNYTGMRITNLLLIFITLYGFKLISDKLGRNDDQKRLLLVTSIIAYLGILRFSVEAIALGVTDILIATWLLYAFAALAHQKYLLAGLLLGAAQACKLLPAPFALLVVMIMLWGTRELWQVVIGFAFSALAITLPFLLWDPEAFISATFLYYLTHHAGGDDTSLWYFLPQLLQTPFLLIGMLASVYTLWRFARLQTLAGGMAAIFCCYVLFMAFSKMTHLNYLWGVFPLGCMALALFIQPNRTP